MSEVQWHGELEHWFEPFLAAFSHKKQRHWAPVYLAGLVQPGRRKSVEPMAGRVAPGQVQQLHNFVSTSRWDPGPVRAVLAARANELVGGEDSHLIVDDTALVKKGRHSPGVAHQYCGELGKKANCQALVSLTLARDEVPVPISLELFLPEAWAGDAKRRARAYVPQEVVHRPKWKIALDEIDLALERGVVFGDVLTDAGYGVCTRFRRGLDKRKLPWAVGIQPQNKVYPAGVELRDAPVSGKGRRPKHPIPTHEDVSAREMIDSLPNKSWRAVTWRGGTKGPLKARFAMVRVRVADGAKLARGRRAPGAEVWLIGEQGKAGARKYYLSNLPAKATRRRLAATIKARWVCEQGHQQMKQELGLDHYEGRSWHGLHHHALLVMIACAFVQHLRLGEKKRRTPKRRPARTEPA